MVKGPAPPRVMVPDVDVSRPCVTCRWVQRTHRWHRLLGQEPRCALPRQSNRRDDPVSGRVDIYLPRCSELRAWDGACKPNGLQWEPKEPRP